MPIQIWIPTLATSKAESSLPLEVHAFAAGPAPCFQGDSTVHLEKGLISVINRCFCRYLWFPSLAARCVAILMGEPRNRHVWRCGFVLHESLMLLAPIFLIGSTLFHIYPWTLLWEWSWPPSAWRKRVCLGSRRFLQCRVRGAEEQLNVAVIDLQKPTWSMDTWHMGR